MHNIIQGLIGPQDFIPRNQTFY